MGFADITLAIDFSHRKEICENSPSILFTVIFTVSKDTSEHRSSMPQVLLPTTISHFFDSAFVSIKTIFESEDLLFKAWKSGIELYHKQWQSFSSVFFPPIFYLPDLLNLTKGESLISVGSVSEHSSQGSSCLHNISPEDALSQTSTCLFQE